MDSDTNVSLLGRMFRLQCSVQALWPLGLFSFLYLFIQPEIRSNNLHQLDANVTDFAKKPIFMCCP